LFKSLTFVVGPTCIGKSDFAIKLAKKIKGEIINADSMQVYKELKILTARPSKEDQSLIPHHLYGHVSGAYRYNVDKWCNEVIKIININNKKNINSIIVGGTGLYIDKLLNGLANIPQIPEIYKKKSQQILLELGNNLFFEEVKKIDKKSCNNISKNDVQRLKRIWEVFQYTKKPISYWQSSKHKKYLHNRNYKILLFLPERKKIYDKIDLRFTSMIDRGVIEEVKNLLSLNIAKDLPIMRAHGVPEISKFLSGDFDLNQCIQRSQQVTRNYAKRQMTWWRSSKLEINNYFEDFPGNIDLKLLKI